MSKVRLNRSVGRVAVRCANCDWVWEPRPDTKDSGPRGNQNAISVAHAHGKAWGHLVTVTKETHYNFISE